MFVETQFAETVYMIIIGKNNIGNNFNIMYQTFLGLKFTLNETYEEN